MKTLFFTLGVIITVFTGFANEQYHDAMRQSIEKLYQSQTIPDYIESANQFERIALNEKKEWLPLYYAAYAYIMISFQEQDNAQKDRYLDRAQSYLDQAIALEPNESELHMLQGFLYPSRINIDPMNRGITFMGKMNESLDKALQLNPDNPRVYFLRATMTFHMPEAYGGGAAKALPLFKTASEKFAAFEPKTDISPDWGKEGNEAEYKKAMEQSK